MSEENWTSKVIKYSITLLEQNLISHNFISNQIYVIWKKTPKHCIENTSVSYFILKHNKNNGDITTGTTNWVSTRCLLCSKCFACFLAYLYNAPVSHTIKMKQTKVSKCPGFSAGMKQPYLKSKVSLMWKAHVHCLCQYFPNRNYLSSEWLLRYLNITWTLFYCGKIHVT